METEYGERVKRRVRRGSEMKSKEKEKECKERERVK